MDLTLKFFEKLKLCFAEGHVVFHQEGGGLKFKMCVCVEQSIIDFKANL